MRSWWSWSWEFYHSETWTLDDFGPLRLPGQFGLAFDQDPRSYCHDRWWRDRLEGSDNRTRWWQSPDSQLPQLTTTKYFDDNVWYIICGSLSHIVSANVDERWWMCMNVLIFIVSYYCFSIVVFGPGALRRNLSSPNGPGICTTWVMSMLTSLAWLLPWQIGCACPQTSNFSDPLPVCVSKGGTTYTTKTGQKDPKSIKNHEALWNHTACRSMLITLPDLQNCFYTHLHSLFCSQMSDDPQWSRYLGLVS